MGLPSTLEAKLDMALDELVERRSEKDRTSGNFGPSRKGHDRDDNGPYASGDRSRGDAKQKGRGKGKRKLPPEEKSLLNTHCFYNSAGDLVVKLYDTEVLVLKKKEPLEPAKVGLQPSEGDSKPVSAPTKPSLVLILNTGGFRTAETKIVLSEALKPLAFRIEGSESSKWQLCSDFKPPGQVKDEATSQPFEDGMEVPSPSLITAADVHQHMVERIYAAKASADAIRKAERGESHRPVPPPGSWGPPPPAPWGVPPPGWPLPPHPHPHPHYRGPLPPHMMPPWAGPSPSWPPPGALRPPGQFSASAPPTGKPRSLRPPLTGPVTDDMFQ